uniref:Uncharacterized protein n=1 Tax=Glossina austeni TaxID=7395 RepID=A0A1A9USR4_GLOAU
MIASQQCYTSQYSEIFNTTLAKRLLFYACRGDRLDPGIKLQRTETDGDGLSISSVSYKMPIHADFLISYSTIPELFYALRDFYKNKT